MSRFNTLEADLDLRHYAHEAMSGVEVVEQKDEPAHKPQGLWLSVGEAWPEWCEAEQFSGGWSHVYRLTLHREPNVLHLSTSLEILDFTEAFRQTPDCYSFDDTMHIGWERVAGRWDGIVIAPYQYSCRLDPKTTWYYGWDCASGCIWNPRCVAGVELMETEVAA